MYFVTTKRPGYALFCTTPSERAAVGVTDDQRRVHLLAREGGDWRVQKDWPVEKHSHTEILVRLGTVDEPASVAELARLAVGG